MAKKVVVALLVILVAVVILFFVARITGFVNITSINSCFDSDFGRNYNIKGQVTGIYYLFTEQKFNEEDKCKNNKVLIEYYCISDTNRMNFYKKSETYKCQASCENGACIGEGEGKPLSQRKCLISFLCK